MAEIAVNLKGQDNLTNTVKNATKAVDDLKYHSTELGKSYKEFEKITSSSKSLKAQLNQLKALMADMNMKGLSGTEEFQQIAQYAGQVKDAISDASTAVDKFSSDTQNLDAAVQALQGIAAAGSIATGAMALFGTENEAVTQAILKVQSALAILNGVQAVANVLNKDSALMLKLKTLWTNSNTVAERANSAATAVNTAATTANTVATESATVAQRANNAALLANPYVLAAAAVAALTAGIIAWVTSNNDATDSQMAVNAAIDAFNEQAEQQMNKVADQIATFNNLKKTYDESGGKVDILTDKIINNKNAQKTLGVVLKTVDDVHRLFGRNTQHYVNAAIARSNALAAEAAEAAMLGQALSALSKIYAKLMKGEEVDYADFVKALENVGIDNYKAWQMMQKAGGKYESDIVYGNLVVDKDKIADFMKNMNAELTKEFFENGPGKTLQELYEASMQDFETETIDFNDLLEENNQKTKETAKHTKNTTQHTKNTKEEIKKILTSLEGCDAIIQEATKQMSKLDSKAKDYKEKLEQAKKTILTARVAKLQLLDQNTLSGLAESKTLIQQIINDLPKGSESLAEWQSKLKDINEKSYNFASAMAINGGLADLKNVQSALDNIISNLSEGSEELQQWVNLWVDVNKKIEKQKKEVANLKAGIEKNSVKDIQDQIALLDEQLKNKNLSISARVAVQAKKDELQREIDEKTNGQVTIKAQIRPSFTVKGSIDDLRQSYDNAESAIRQLQTDYEKGIITADKFKTEVIKINEQVQEIGMKPIRIDFKSNLDNILEQVNEYFSGFDAFNSLIDSFENMVNVMRDNTNAWEKFVSVIQVAETALQTYSAIQTVIKNLSILTEKSKLQEAAAITAATAATGEKAAADTAAIPTTTANTVALKAQEAAYMDTAAAAIFAAHAAIPFAGVGIASGMVAAMMAAMTAQHAASAALAAFKEGGIVGGSYAEHPILAHKGEMILNEHQQQKLFDILDSGGSVNNMGNVQFVLKGSDLYGSFSNYTKIKSKVGKI